MCFRCLYILSSHLIFDLLHFMSSEESDSLNDEYDKLGSDSGSSGKYSFCAFICVFAIPLIVLVFWGGAFLHQQESSPKVIFLCLTRLYQQESSPRVSDLSKYFGAQIPYFLSKFEIQFYSYCSSQTFPCSLQPL